MKKVKVMLLVVTMFAAVGGAMAFKASKFGVKYCIGAAWVSGMPATGAVNSTPVLSTTVSATAPFYATTFNNIACPATAPTLFLKGE